MYNDLTPFTKIWIRIEAHTCLLVNMPRWIEQRIINSRLQGRILKAQKPEVCNIGGVKIRSTDVGPRFVPLENRKKFIGSMSETSNFRMRTFIGSKVKCNIFRNKEHLSGLDWILTEFLKHYFYRAFSIFVDLFFGHKRLSTFYLILEVFRTY